jgi:hypothetical protein
MPCGLWFRLGRSKSFRLVELITTRDIMKIPKRGIMTQEDLTAAGGSWLPNLEAGLRYCRAGSTEHWTFFRATEAALAVT